MALGRRSRRSERAKLDATPPWQDDREQEREQDRVVTAGPWDVADAPQDNLERVDLGALQVPVLAGVELRVEVDPNGQVVAATLSAGGSEMQIGVFAAPRNAGIWDDVRREIRGTIATQGGTAQDTNGRFGTELTGKVPVAGGMQAVRFVGVDGPRWMLRALFSGPAVADPARAAALEDALRSVIVVRGSAPMPVRDPLPLELPKDVAEQVAQQAASGVSAGAAGPDTSAGQPRAPRQPARADRSSRSSARHRRRR
jgi:Protein of unknown function (DUF3710)